MAKRVQGLALVALLIAVIVIGAAPPEPPQPYDIHAHPWMTLPGDTPLAMTGGECDDFGLVGPIVDDDGDGYANEADPSCIVLSDLDGNGICDYRGFGGIGTESGPDYPTDGCTGWE